MLVSVRDDIANVPFAHELGFAAKQESNNGTHGESEYHLGDKIPHNTLHFEIGHVIVWFSSGWRFAELIDRSYQNHSDFTMDLQECLLSAKARYEEYQAKQPK